MSRGWYRYPGETIILTLTFILLAGVMVLTAAPTICLSPLFVVVFIGMAYQANLAHQRQIMNQATAITPQTAPALAELTRQCEQYLRPGPVDYYVVRSRALNAYTFGISGPRTVVLYSSLLQLMDPDELKFIIGHELGHVALNHTWLNTLLGGMAGVPASFGAAIILTFAFRWWNRACEYSADRAGLLACGSLEKAITALVKLVAGDVRTQAQLEQAIQAIDAQDDSPLNSLAESLSTHPMVIKRITELRKFAASPEFRSATARATA